MSAYSNILTYLLPGEPRVSRDLTGSYISYTYRGPTATLVTNTPQFNDDWNGIPVIRVSGPRTLEITSYSELIVEAKSIDSAAVVAAGIAAVAGNEFPLYEVEEVPVQVGLFGHPAWSGLTDADKQAIAEWKNEQSTVDRAAYSYHQKDYQGNATALVVPLSTAASPTKSAQDMAKLMLSGIDTYTDYYPVARKTEVMFGQDLATVGPIGDKISGDPFTGVPSGYVWILTAYRRQKQGRGYYWTRTREWTGYKAVRIDSSTVY